MAMAATPVYASSIATTTITTTKPLSRSLPRSNLPAPNPYSLRTPSSLSLRAAQTTRRPVVFASASTAFEVDQAPASAAASKVLPFRVGHGFDLHRLEPGYPLIIGGINIPHDKGCEAHSDGDVLLHCVVDAILGALGLPDIGQIFPDSDPKWRGADSSVFIREADVDHEPHAPEPRQRAQTPGRILKHWVSMRACVPFGPNSWIFCSAMIPRAPSTSNLMDSKSESKASNPNSWLQNLSWADPHVRLMHEAGYEIGNLDATLILQRPKLSPHKETMRANLAKLLGADPSVVNLKAKTHEKVDSLGENRSIAAHTVVLLMRK
ncbi:hypothetical protein ACE6H2_017336 [Prunus campanulata]